MRRTLLSLALPLALALTACGGSGPDANTLLRQTFGGNHPIKSGQLQFSLRLDPSGSSTLSTPITLSFGGPFQSLGTGKLPASNFELTFNGLGHSGSIGLLSTGSSGYVTLQGTSYQLPAATFQRLESSFAGFASGTGASPNGSGEVLAKLGIEPLHWLDHAQVVGHDQLGGVDTTHIHAQVNVAALLSDLSTFMQKASSLGVSGSTALQNGIPASTRQQIASTVQDPTVDVWTGSSDKTLRRLQLHLTLPVSGQIATLLGGLRSAGIGLSLGYGDLNQPQTISTPTNVHPFSEFQGKLRGFLAAVQQASAAATGGATSAPQSQSQSSSGGSASALHSYTACLQQAGQDVLKMQRCGSLLKSGG